MAERRRPLWSIKAHPINKEEGFIPPKRKVHPYKYQHEKACGEAFVYFALSGQLYDWQQHKRISDTIIPDRIAEYPKGQTLYIEIELGERDRVSEKIQNYLSYHRQTGQRFKVLFLVKQMRDWQAPPHYEFKLLSEIHSIPHS
jgi:hypothetical protein